MLTRLPCPLLGSDCARFATGRAFVPCVNVVKMCDVLGRRVIRRVHALEGGQRLLAFVNPLGGLPVHVV